MLSTIKAPARREATTTTHDQASDGVPAAGFPPSMFILCFLSSVLAVRSLNPNFVQIDAGSNDLEEHEWEDEMGKRKTEKLGRRDEARTAYRTLACNLCQVRVKLGLLHF
ncbi:hypothetical protein Droror1_Dr00010130 [Drosera rotundifolia]